MRCPWCFPRPNRFQPRPRQEYKRPNPTRHFQVILDLSDQKAADSTNTKKEPKYEQSGRDLDFALHNDW